MKGGLLQRYRSNFGESQILPWQSADYSGADGAAGFTMVEVLIVLAVTGALFLSAVLLINGRQNKTEFTQAIQEIQSEIQQNITDVANGYYANTKNFTCTSNGSTITITGGGNAAGTNAGCIFLGKALQFSPQSATSNQPYNVYSIAGVQQDAAGNQITSLTNADPKVVTQSNQSTPLEYGLTATQMYYDGNPANKIGTVAFVSSLGSLDTNGQLSSGSQQLTLMPITGTALGDTAATDIARIPVALKAASPVINPPGGVSICFKSATTNQSGLITIGGNSQVLSVTLSVKGNTTCS